MVSEKPDKPDKPQTPVVYWFNRLKKELYTLFYVIKDPRTPFYLKIIPFVVPFAYVLFPFDLIPDMIPFIGYVDDTVLIPLIISFVFYLIPEHILADSRIKADQALGIMPEVFETKEEDKDESQNTSQEMALSEAEEDEKPQPKKKSKLRWILWSIFIFLLIIFASFITLIVYLIRTFILS